MTDILTLLVGVGVTILVAGIPWAYSVHGRLTGIEAGLKAVIEAQKLLPPKWLLDRVENLEHEVEKLKERSK